MAYKFVQLYDKSGIKTYTAKGPACYLQQDDNGTGYWYKFATFTTSTSYEDFAVTFQVSSTYNQHGYGLLYVHARRPNSVTIEHVQMQWIAHSTQIRPLQWAWVATDNKIELYNYKPHQHYNVHIEVLKGDTRIQTHDCLNSWVMTLYNSYNTAGLSAIPSGTSSGVSVSSQYKVGDILCSTSSTHPSTYYGGSWETIQDRFLIGAGNNYGEKKTGGSTTSKIETGHMPSHSHTMPSHNHWLEFSSGNGGDHTHGVQSHNGNTGSWEYLRPSGWTGGNGWRQVDGVGAHSHWVAGWTGGNNGAGSTNATGGSTALPIMPPWYGVYFWRRTA